MESWPSNPVHHFISSISKIKPHAPHKPLVIADLGCGEAELARSLLALNPTPPLHAKFEVHSFDLASPNELVVACDIRDLPMEKEVVDVAVFCLSLMGTNFLDFLKEAWRVLRVG